MLRALGVLVGVWVLSSCTQKMVCPAYQSAFIFDKPTAREQFVYFNADTANARDVVASADRSFTLPPKPTPGTKAFYRGDSVEVKYEVMQGPALPKAKTVKRDRYLLMPRKTYQKALRSLMTVEMKPVYPKKVEDDSAMAARQLANIIRDENDSKFGTRPEAKGDSVYVISKAKEKFNVEQDNYLWYFRDMLVLPDVRLAMEGQAGGESSEGGQSSRKKGFFKNLFGKKKKSANDSTYMKDLQSTDYPLDSATSSPKKKKGLSLNPFKKKSKVDPAATPKPQQPARKEEEDDGF
ncbi:MAG: hypothetical protein ACK5V5_04085 [Cyclobacteriaceae bacterium]|jgi:hypothetical protein|nr:hypothetical protein [Flammeovirgaceae bacterium]